MCDLRGIDDRIQIARVGSRLTGGEAQERRDRVTEEAAKTTAIQNMKSDMAMPTVLSSIHG